MVGKTEKKNKGGRPKGSYSAKTLERMAVNKAIQQRIFKNADKILTGQLQLALGSMKVFRVDELGDGKKTHTHVTDHKEIKELLDNHEGNAGTVNGKYYFFADVLPDNKAIESLFNRALGKPSETVKLVNEDGVTRALEALQWYIEDNPAATSDEIQVVVDRIAQGHTLTEDDRSAFRQRMEQVVQVISEVQ